MERTPVIQQAGCDDRTPKPYQDSRREEAEKQSERQTGGRDDANEDDERGTVHSI